MRFCVDLRKLNDIVEQENYPLPKIQDVISTLTGKNYFSLIDLKDGFFHIDIKAEDRYKTAFYCGNRLMQFNKMPQGFKNSPSIFQQAMQYIFGDLIDKACIIYIDDILVFGATKKEHNENFNLVKNVIDKYGLQENKEKRIFCKNEVCFLGYNIGNNKISPKEERAQGIINFKKPESRKEVQRLLGLVNYDRQFVKNLSEVTMCLTELINKERKFYWEEKHDIAFEKIKEIFKSKLETIIPDWSKPFVLETDASDKGLGAVLRQENGLISCASRKLSLAEQAYGITEKEVLAALWGMEKFQFHLLGKKFTLVTDHKAITFMNSKPEFGSLRVQRWFERFSRFNFNVEYKKGEKMIQADALSRAPMVNTVNEEMNLVKTKVMNIHIKYNHRKNLQEKLKEEGTNISSEKIKKILLSCERCAKRDLLVSKSSKYVETSYPGERLGIDLMITSKKELIALGIDYYSRKLYAKLIKSKQAKYIIQFLNEIYKEIKFETLVADNGREFDNHLVKDWLKEKNIKYDQAIPYYHKSNGRIERANRTIRNAIRKTKGDLKDNLSVIIENYNNILHRALGTTPNEALRPENRERINKRIERYKKEFNEEHQRSYKIDDKVLVKDETRKTKDSPWYKEKGKIIRKKNNKYEIILGNNKKIIRHASQLKQIV